MYKNLLLIGLVALASCTVGGPEPESDVVVQTNTVHNNAKNTFDTAARIIDLAGCYEMTMKLDTAQMKLTINDSIVTGELVYDWNEQDGNKGTLKGVLRDSLIVAEYAYESEGLLSVREVIFKIEDNFLQQAVGDLDQQNNKIIYKDKSRLDFNLMPPFMKIPCSN